MEQSKQITTGEWFCAMDGLAIAEKIYTFYYEEYDKIPDGKKVGDFNVSVVEYKLFCDFDGTPIRRNRHKYFNADCCSPIKQKYQKILKKSINDHPKEYASFTKLLKATKEFKDCKWLVYEISPDNIQKVTQDIERIKEALPSKFTFQDVLKVASENNCIIDFTKFESGSYCLEAYLDIMLAYTFGDFEQNKVLFHKFNYKICVGHLGQE